MSSEALATTKTAGLASVDPAGIDLNKLFAMAIERGPEGVATLERMMTMRREMKAEAAKEAYFISLAQFQKECPPVPKRAEVMNKDGRSVRYRFAPIVDVAEHIAPYCELYGFSYVFDSELDKGTLTALCRVTHREGHTETSKFALSVGAPTNGMSVAQAHASALSYAKRYALLGAFGLHTTDEDDDANSTLPDNSAKAKLARFRERERMKVVHGGPDADAPPHEEFTDVPETITSEVRDFLTMVADAKDRDDIQELSTQCQGLSDGPGKDTARAALLSKTSELGFAWRRGELVKVSQ